VATQRLISIAEVLRDAELGDLTRVLGEPRQPYDLFGATGRLFELLASRGVSYVLVGGIAMLQYVEGRNTRDIDLIMSPADLDRLTEFEVSSRDKDFARASFEGVQVDLLLTANPVFELVRTQHAAQREFAERSITCATPGGMVLLKLFALPSLYRQGEFGRVGIYENDIAVLLERIPMDASSLVATLESHMLPSDIQQIREVLDDIRGRLARFKGAAGVSTD